MILIKFQKNRQKYISIFYNPKYSFAKAFVHLRQDESIVSFLKLDGAGPKANTKRHIKGIISNDFKGLLIL